MWRERNTAAAKSESIESSQRKVTEMAYVSYQS
jgi:hypothetical protein